MSEKDHTATTKNDNNLGPGDVVSGLEASELVEIQRVARNTFFDEQPCAGTSSDDINL